MKKALILPGLFLLLITVTITTINFSPVNEETEAVKTVILDGYINGAFNDLDPDAMERSFHKDFAIYSANGNEISKYPIAQWVESVRKRKGSEDFDPTQNKWEHTFASVDITGNSAAVKVELHRKGTHVYTDYLSLLKFDDGWKIVAKVYHQHGR